MFARLFGLSFSTSVFEFNLDFQTCLAGRGMDRALLAVLALPGFSDGFGDVVLSLRRTTVEQILAVASKSSFLRFR